jgi:hypothetical protein
MPGWHKVVDENGVILGYLHLLGGVTKVLDADGKYIGGHEVGLERPFIDPIDIFAGGIGGVVRGSLRGVLSALARRAAPRLRVAGFLASQGLRSTVPMVAGDLAPSAYVMAETLAAKSVPNIVRGVSGTAARGAVGQGTRAESASVIEALTTKGATSAANQGVASAASTGLVTAVSASSTGAQAVAGVAGATVAGAATPSAPAVLDTTIDEAFNQTFNASTLQAAGPAAQQGIVSVAPEIAAGFTQVQVAAFRRVLGRALDTEDIKVLQQLWNAAARPGDATILNAANSRSLFNLQRNRFWSRVAANPQAAALFTDAGCQFSGGAPYFILNGRRIVITMDHIIERQTVPNLALTASNLRLAFSRENSVVLRLLNQLDPFQ